MTTDRELLELAAKAAGMSRLRWSEHQPKGLVPAIIKPNERGWWNPLTDDGDALRLAVKLNLNVCCYGWRFDAKRGGIICATEYTPASGGDPLAATRRAIVRAAAEIGRAMP